ncbi:MAG TPA: Stk1 family PASTA domain-containing Ser/Thr kinase, partial [Gaiellaceae bacterium]|nr:Stk1 family PASTA domain-containing Ser/Thr kinase [Gaiellaceae bacterium]
MANVYLAVDEELGRRVAIKILNERHANDEQFVARFRQEAKNAAALSHPNIVAIFDRGEAEGTYYIAMEYLEGKTLKELIVSRGPAPVNVAIEYARQILSALKFAHRHGIVHRDIKPHNVLVDGEGRVKVTDFGIARAGASEMTEVGSIVGTAQYLSPEQARGAGVDPRSDLYSLGVVLYELLTGESPFDGDTPVEIAMKHLSQTPEPPSAHRSELPEELDWVVTRALAKHPDDRYQSADEMDTDLERVMRGAAVSAETEDTATQIIRAPALPIAASAPTAATMIAPPLRRGGGGGGGGVMPPVPMGYYEEERPRRRPVWPWLAALVFVLVAGAGGWYVYNQISSQISSNAPVSVELYVNETQATAESNIRQIHLVPKVINAPSQDTAKGLVFKQDPAAGHKIAQGNPVTIWVSTGKPQVAVPDLKGQQQADAEKALNDLKLKPEVHQVPGGRQAGIVTATDPGPGAKVDQGTTVRVNVTSGPKPVKVPNVVGKQLDVATSQLQRLGFVVTPTFQHDPAAANEVTDQSTAPGATAPKGSTITLTVSSGPQTAPVPDVTGQAVDAAAQTLASAGFKVQTQPQDTLDPTQDNVVIAQSPGPNNQAPKGSTVTLTVGHFVASTDTTTTTPTPTPATTTTQTP